MGKSIMNYLAIDVGGTFTKYAVVTDTCEIVVKNKKPTRQETLEIFIDSLVEIYEEIKKEYDIKGIGLSMPGMIDSKTGFMYTGGNIRCVVNLNIVEIMENRCGLPVTVENDAKCAALAELWNGSVKDCQDAIVLVCGTGVGGAVIKNKKILTGKHFLAGEFSYCLTESTPDYAMRNCLAETAGVGALMSYVSEEIGISAEELDGVKVFSMANQGDKKAIAGLRRYVKNIAIQIHNLQYIFDPERFAIGGGISVQPLLLQMLKEELQKINAMFPWTLPVPEVVVCSYFNDANLIGAVYVHLKSREKTLSIEKMQELIDLVGDRREAEYLREFLTD